MLGGWEHLVTFHSSMISKTSIHRFSVTYYYYCTKDLSFSVDRQETTFSSVHHRIKSKFI
ncbi:hypothetical protein BKA56DRAFT_599473 [Ilyonectria sp. MPI-CAGE-AT-0026]|nr:hypothetical protein BKA56DRAFT_599473 [Ilyonectria sp. MPI-CAGE-AT-0026]